MTPHPMYIGGAWVPGRDTRQAINPTTGKPFAEVYIGDANDVARAVAAARAAFRHGAPLASNIVQNSCRAWWRHW